MALISTIEELNRYVTVSSNFDDPNILKFTKKSERNLSKQLGKEKFEEIESRAEDDEVRELLCEYSANIGLSYALPNLIINITQFGAFTNLTSKSEKAEWWQLKDLNRNLLKFGFTALDDALLLIGTNEISTHKDLFVSSLSQFERCFSIKNSPQTFLSLIPFLRESQEQFLKPTLGDCFDYDFDASQLNDIRAALVNLALSKAATSGAFSVEANAMILRFEVLPWEKVEQIQQSALDRFKEDRYNIGMGFLTRVSQFLKELPCYKVKEFISEIEKKESGLFL